MENTNRRAEPRGMMPPPLPARGYSYTESPTPDSHFESRASSVDTCRERDVANMKKMAQENRRQIDEDNKRQGLPKQNCDSLLRDTLAHFNPVAATKLATKEYVSRTKGIPMMNPTGARSTPYPEEALERLESIPPGYSPTPRKHTKTTIRAEAPLRTKAKPTLTELLAIEKNQKEAARRETEQKHLFAARSRLQAINHPRQAMYVSSNAMQQTLHQSKESITRSRMLKPKTPAVSTTSRSLPAPKGPSANRVQVARTPVPRVQQPRVEERPSSTSNGSKGLVSNEDRLPSVARETPLPYEASHVKMVVPVDTSLQQEPALQKLNDASIDRARRPCPQSDPVLETSSPKTRKRSSKHRQVATVAPSLRKTPPNVVSESTSYAPRTIQNSHKSPATDARTGSKGRFIQQASPPRSTASPRYYTPSTASTRDRSTPLRDESSSMYTPSSRDTSPCPSPTHSPNTSASLRSDSGSAKSGKSSSSSYIPRQVLSQASFIEHSSHRFDGNRTADIPIESIEHTITYYDRDHITGVLFREESMVRWKHYTAISRKWVWLYDDEIVGDLEDQKQDFLWALRYAHEQAVDWRCNRRDEAGQFVSDVDDAYSIEFIRPALGATPDHVECMVTQWIKRDAAIQDSTQDLDATASVKLNDFEIQIPAIDPALHQAVNVPVVEEPIRSEFDMDESDEEEATRTLKCSRDRRYHPESDFDLKSPGEWYRECRRHRDMRHNSKMKREEKRLVEEEREFHRSGLGMQQCVLGM